MNASINSSSQVFKSLLPHRFLDPPLIGEAWNVDTELANFVARLQLCIYNHIKVRVGFRNYKYKGQPKGTITLGNLHVEVVQAASL